MKQTDKNELKERLRRLISINKESIAEYDCANDTIMSNYCKGKISAYRTAIEIIEEMEIDE